MDLMHLTPADVTLAVSRMSDHIRSNERFRDQELHRIDQAVGDFLGGGRRVPDSAKWRALVLWDLSEEMCSPMEIPDEKEVPTWEAVESVFEADLQRAQRDHQEWFEDDPEEFRRTQSWLGEPVEGQPVPHPWGQDVITLCRAWLASTPYEVWWSKDQVAQQVRYEVEDQLVNMVIGKADGKSVARLAVEQLTRTLKMVRGFLVHRVEEMKVTAAVGDALRSKPLGG